jgi:hypothetical protein
MKIPNSKVHNPAIINRRLRGFQNSPQDVELVVAIIKSVTVKMGILLPSSTKKVRHLHTGKRQGSEAGWMLLIHQKQLKRT